MTNIDLVKLSLSKIKKHDGCVITDQIREHTRLTNEQIRRSMRDVKGVIKIDKDTWRVKGRSTPDRQPPYIKKVWDSQKLGTFKKGVLDK